MQIVSAEQAVSEVRSGERVFLHSVAAAPQRLIAALVGRAAELRAVELIHLHTEPTSSSSAPTSARRWNRARPTTSRCS